jgi:3-hydroxypropanoate dehydrogenase
MFNPINTDCIDQIFISARSHSGWKTDSVSEPDLRVIYEIAKWGPTTANSQPQRIVFCVSPESKARLHPAMSKTNYEKTATAPVVAILAYDLDFCTNIHRMYAKNPKAGDYYTTSDEVLRTTALRNASMQAAYFILAARALGFDCGPMSGFKNEVVDAEFFPEGRWKSNMLCAVGRGDAAKLHQKDPRLTFEEACKFA